MKVMRHANTATIRSSMAHALIACMAIAVATSSAMAASKSVAFLGVHLQNDNEMYEPTSGAERTRMANTEKEFVKALDDSGSYKVLPTPHDVRARIEAGQSIGDCGGCELDFGKEIGGDIVAWINVQKVSNLILNMNVFMADTATGKRIFTHSVDIRGNTDETWARSLAYLVKNYLLAPASQAPQPQG